MSASTIAAPRFPRAAGVAVTAWLALVLLAGATGFLVRLPFPGPQLIFLALFVATLVAATAVLALILVAAGEPRTPLQRGLTHAWNVFGFLDLAVAVGTATAVTLQGSTPGVAPVLYLPLVLVPTFFVPIFLANHVIIFRRLRAAARMTHGA